MNIRTCFFATAMALFSIPALAGAPEVGDSPEFAFTTMDGVEVSSDDLGGQVVIFDFWATW